MWSALLILKTAIGYTYYASYKIGQFIVTTLEILLTNNLYFLNKLLTILTVIIEDFTIFISDVTQGVNNIIQGMAYIGERIAAILSGTVQGLILLPQLVQAYISAIFKAGFNGISALVNAVKTVFIIIKQLLVMFGDGVWFIVIYIPKSVLSLIPLSFYYVKDFSVQSYNSIYANIKSCYNSFLKSLRGCYHFLTDVPVESIVGIVIAICFLYVFLQFYSILHVYLSNKITSLLQGLRLKYNHLKSSLHRLLHRSNRVISRPIFDCKPATSTKSNNDASRDGSCIICQEHDKCILVLPCKHLCLCVQCTPRLMRYTGRCPICRKRINSTMKVFT